MQTHILNPYWGKDFFSFFVTLLYRLFLFVQGKIPIEDLSIDEIQIIVIAAVAISSAIVGSFLVLKKMTMQAHSISHTILIGIILAFLITGGAKASISFEMSFFTLFIASLITACLTIVLTEILFRVLRLQEDAAIGLVFTSLFALGIILASIWTRNSNISVEAVMGNADILQVADIKPVYLVLLFNLVVLFIFFKEIHLVLFDPKFAKTLGVSYSFFSFVFMLQTSITSLGAFRSVGVVLVLACLVTPVLIAKTFSKRLLHLILLSSGIGVVSCVVGVALTRHFLSVHELALSTQAMVVVIQMLGFMGVVLFSKVKKQS